ncbi:unnamed protein product [Gulo gulo]|uniref:Uncharacterized protein n=1 Tax=Gulo gulo TaxID=48420 RepID=A0A9X9PV23_GULGU|nr:unnamed protein product [Gulo gulo]
MMLGFSGEQQGGLGSIADVPSSRGCSRGGRRMKLKDDGWRHGLGSSTGKAGEEVGCTGYLDR